MKKNNHIYMKPHTVGEKVSWFATDHKKHEGKVVVHRGQFYIEGDDSNIYPLEILENQQ